MGRILQGIYSIQGYFNVRRRHLGLHIVYIFMIKVNSSVKVKTSPSNCLKAKILQSIYRKGGYFNVRKRQLRLYIVYIFIIKVNS